MDEWAVGGGWGGGFFRVLDLFHFLLVDLLDDGLAMEQPNYLLGSLGLAFRDEGVWALGDEVGDDTDYNGEDGKKV